MTNCMLGEVPGTESWACGTAHCGKCGWQKQIHDERVARIRSGGLVKVKPNYKRFVLPDMELLGLVNPKRRGYGKEKART